MIKSYEECPVCGKGYSVDLRPSALVVVCTNGHNPVLITPPNVMPSPLRTHTRENF